MTKVLLIHNPFDVKTEIIIDQEPIQETSVMYKYLNTPMQDWVTAFLPALVEHCNDDEFDITFKGLQFNYDDLEAELELFLRKNRDCDMELHFDVSKSQMARLGAVENLLEEVAAQSKIPELKQQELMDVLSAAQIDTLQVVVVGGTDASRHRFVDKLIEADFVRTDDTVGYCVVDDDSIGTTMKSDTDDSFQRYVSDIDFVSSKYCHMEIYELPNLETCKNCYYRFAKQAIESEDKPIVIYLLNDDPRKNSEKFLNMVSDRYTMGGKRNKQRFIFVAEDVSSAKYLLKSEYVIKNAAVYTPEDISPIRRRLEEYRNEVCLVHQLKERCDLITNHLSALEAKIAEKAEQDKKVSEIDALEQQAMTLLHECTLTQVFEQPDCKAQDAQITAYFKQLGTEYRDIAEGKITPEGVLVVARSYERERKGYEAIPKFIRNLPSKIEKQMVAERAATKATSNISIPYELEGLLAKLSCDAGINQIKAFSPVSWGSEPPTAPYMARMRDIPIRMDNNSYDGAASMEANSFFYKLAIKCHKANYFYEKGQGKKTFMYHLEKLRPILKEYYDACVSMAKAEAQAGKAELKELLADIESQISRESQRLREAAEISEAEKEKLRYICDLRSKFEELTCL